MKVNLSWVCFLFVTFFFFFFSFSLGGYESDGFEEELSLLDDAVSLIVVVVMVRKVFLSFSLYLCYLFFLFLTNIIIIHPLTHPPISTQAQKSNRGVEAQAS